MRIGAVVAVMVVGGCSAGDVDLSGKACPCGEGWYCDRPSRTCKPGLPPDEDAGAAEDAAADAAIVDAGETVDAAMTMDAGSDAGGADDAGFDAGFDGGIDTTLCDGPLAGAVFCDGLEPPGFPAWTSTYMTSGFVGRAVDQTFLGLGSLYGQVDSGGGAVAARYVFPTVFGEGDDVYLRAWIYIPSTVPSGGGFSFYQAGEDGAPYGHASLGLNSSGDLDLYVVANGGSRTVIGGALPRDDWVCVEAHVHLSDTAGSVELWKNEVSQGRAMLSDTLPDRGYERIVAGLPYTEADQPSACIYLDELVVDASPIGCD